MAACTFWYGDPPGKAASARIHRNMRSGRVGFDVVVEDWNDETIIKGTTGTLSEARKIATTAIQRVAGKKKITWTCLG